MNATNTPSLSSTSADCDVLTCDVQTCGDVAWRELKDLLARFGLELEHVADGLAIPGSYWGESEAGLLGHRVLARTDTPVHSLLHEACHAICADPQRRANLDTDALSDDAEEDAVCMLQILLADHIGGVGRERLMADMDAWGYSFRLGSTRAYFEEDSAPARRWLSARNLVQSAPTGELAALFPADP